MAAPSVLASEIKLGRPILVFFLDVTSFSHNIIWQVIYLYYKG